VVETSKSHESDRLVGPSNEDPQTTVGSSLAMAIGSDMTKKGKDSVCLTAHSVLHSNKHNTISDWNTPTKENASSKKSDDDEFRAYMNGEE
jgi:hypothetical protein